jgi:hypothetical protein
MNLRRTISRFKSLYKKKKIRRIELPEERDARKFYRKAKQMGMKPAEYASYLRKKKEAKKPWYAGRSSGRFKKKDKPKDDYSPGSGRYFRG